ncbi:putative dipeptide ABC transport system ATP-binding component [Klebsiella pneumoniae]|uniref:Putative dipeptide ABC transport system ATP-binding component n=1 Tax=Klebsiella pneumoniae TaxID=573 RepID=A0A377V4S5_KLEPN|nr:putative dipeptide ABC transport system ATP-binding component [Klebsiella pneumoniae]
MAGGGAYSPSRSAFISFIRMKYPAGQGQRIMIAMMLITGPGADHCDEPTSALDVSVRLQVLGLLDDLVQSRGLGLIFISHDINLVRSFCDRVPGDVRRTGSGVHRR